MYNILLWFTQKVLNFMGGNIFVATKEAGGGLPNNPYQPVWKDVPWLIMNQPNDLQSSVVVVTDGTFD